MNELGGCIFCLHVTVNRVMGYRNDKGHLTIKYRQARDEVMANKTKLIGKLTVQITRVLELLSSMEDLFTSIPPTSVRERSWSFIVPFIENDVKN